MMTPRQRFDPASQNYLSLSSLRGSVEIGKVLAERHPSNRPEPMLHWTITFLILALIAGLLGFTGIAGAAVGVAKVLFFVFLVLLVISALSNALRGKAP
jgi:uncharacterized membrane protein YtjA (UPF0391 family)